MKLTDSPFPWAALMCDPDPGIDSLKPLKNN